MHKSAQIYESSGSPPAHMYLSALPRGSSCHKGEAPCSRHRQRYKSEENR